MPSTDPELPEVIALDPHDYSTEAAPAGLGD
jgi:hypothetical protein